jgi:uncharacterized membrane protein
MNKINKGKVILTTLVTLLPIIIGLILWNKLPQRIPTHWNTAGEIDGWSSKAFAVFGLPCILTAIHLLCLIGSSADPKKKNHAGQLWGIVFWICPVISLLMMAVTYGSALGMELKVEKIMMLLVGVMFVVVGNYLPKCKQNYTMGIKIPWTLNDEENWNYTHRLGGKIWVGTGIVSLLCVLLPSTVMAVVLIAVILVATLVPTICSYLFYRKKMKNQ